MRIDTLVKLGNEQFKSKDYENARLTYVLLDSLVTLHSGNDSKLYADICYFRGTTCFRLRNSEEAYEYLTSAISKFKKNNDTLSDNYEGSLDDLAKLLVEFGEFQEGEDMMLQLLKIRTQKYGPVNAKYANTLYTLCIVNAKREDYTKALHYGKRCLEIRDSIFTKRSGEYTSTLYQVSKLYDASGQMELAIASHRENLGLLKDIGKTNVYSYPATMVELATIYRVLGQYQKAEVLYLEANKIYKSDPALQKHLTYGYCLYLSGVYYKELGNFDKALEYLYESKEVMKKLGGGKSWDYYKVIYMIGNVYMHQGNYASAKKVYEMILNTNELSPENKEVNLPYVQGALIALTNVTGDSVPESFVLDYLTIMKNRGAELATNALKQYSSWLFRHSRDKEALEMDQEAYQLLAQHYRSESREMYETCFNLCLDYFKLNQNDSSRKYFLEGRNGVRTNISRSIEYMSDRELNLLVDQNDIHYAGLLGWDGVDDQSYAGQYYDDALFYKGIIQYSRIRKNRIIEKDSSAIELYEHYRSVKRRLASEYSKPIRDQQDVTTLETESNQLEKEINNRLSGIGNYLQEVNWKDLQQTLKESEAAIEFIRYEIKSNSQPTQRFKYAALLIRKYELLPKFIPLCEETQLEKLMNLDSKLRMDYVSRLYSDAGDLTKTNQVCLNRLIWEPIEMHLSNINTIYFTPVGLLHRINLNPISTHTGEMAMDKYNLVLMPSTRDLLMNLKAKPTISTEFVLIGGIEYNKDSTSMDHINELAWNETNRTRGEYSFFNNDSKFRSGKWNYLPGSQNEIDQILKISLKNKNISYSISGHNATEEFVKSLSKSSNRKQSPGIIHISTHGFFFPETKNTELKVDATAILKEPVFKNSTDPMIRSGLILADANYAWTHGKPFDQNTEDGILTAYEISQLDLTNTELVVLSACETGLGDVHGNEGVYGLQRAFKIAGVKNILMSLWQVPDKQTSQLMELFYKNWIQKKLSIRDALLEAQKTMRKKGLEPYYWAGFVLME